MYEYWILAGGLLAIGISIVGADHSSSAVDKSRIPKTKPTAPGFKTDPDNHQVLHTGDPITPTDKNPARTSEDYSKPSEYKYPDVPFRNPDDVRKAAERPIPVKAKPTDVKSVLQEGETRREDLDAHVQLAAELNIERHIAREYDRQRTKEWKDKLEEQKKVVAQRQKELNDFMEKTYGKKPKKDPIVPSTPRKQLCIEGRGQERAPLITLNNDSPPVRYVPCPEKKLPGSSIDPAIKLLLNPFEFIFGRSK